VCNEKSGFKKGMRHVKIRRGVEHRGGESTTSPVGWRSEGQNLGGNSVSVTLRQGTRVLIQWAAAIGQGE